MRKIEFSRTFLYPRDNWKHVKIKKTDWENIKELRLSGYPVKEIALKYNVTSQTIRDVLKGGASKKPTVFKTVEQKRRNRNTSNAHRRFLLSMGLLVKKVKIIQPRPTTGKGDKI